MTAKLSHRKRLFHEQRGLCFYCQKPMLLTLPEPYRPAPRTMATLDHIIPRSLGGRKAPTLNCVAACLSCNQQRGTKDARLFMLEKQGAFA